MLKNYLTSKKVSYVEKMIDTDEQAQKEMEKISGGFLGVPFTNVIKDDGTTSTILGFDKGKVDTILGI